MFVVVVKSEVFEQIESEHGLSLFSLSLDSSPNF